MPAPTASMLIAKSPRATAAVRARWPPHSVNLPTRRIHRHTPTAPLPPVAHQFSTHHGHTRVAHRGPQNPDPGAAGGGAQVAPRGAPVANSVGVAAGGRHGCVARPAGFDAAVSVFGDALCPLGLADALGW